MQHLTSQFRISSLHGYIDRRQMHLYDTFNIRQLHICQRDIVSLQKGQSGVVILKIKCLAHSRRHLINKAENTLVAAGTVFTHKPILEFNSKIFIIIFVNLQKPFFPILFFDQHFNIFIFYQISVVKDILYRLIVDCKEHIPGLNLQLLCD